MTDFAQSALGTRQTFSGHAGWWAVYTRHHHEQAIARVLTAKGVEVFLPTFATSRQWKDRKKIIRMPLFPCYLFAKESLDARLPILQTPGVHMILSNGEQCATIPDREIQTIKWAAQEPLKIEPHPYLNTGERVRVVRGAIAGVEGVLSRKKNGCRLILSVELLNQSAAIEVDSMDVEPLYAPPHAVSSVVIPSHVFASASL